MRLSPRLEAIIEEVNNDLPLADIGTDHCYIPIELIKRGLIPRAVATDINVSPLNRAEREVLKNGLEEKIDLRLGFGLKALDEDEVGQVVISGMGGREIESILKERIDFSKSFKRLILQPMTQQEELRAFLLNNGFEIINERVISEGKFSYQIITAEPGEVQDYDQLDLEIGYAPARTIDSDYLRFLERKIDFYSTSIKRMKASQNEKTRQRRQEFERRLIFLKNFYESQKNSADH